MNASKRISVWIVLFAVSFMIGCARSRFQVTEKINGIETNKTTTVKISTLFNSKSELTKINVSQGMKSKDQGVMVGTVAQEAHETNAAAIFEAIGRGVVSGLKP